MAFYTHLGPVAWLYLYVLVCANVFPLGHCGDADLLLEFANATVGDFPLTGWTEANKDNLCVSWLGITCEGGRVVGIHLTTNHTYDKYLSGTIPDSIVGLDKLQYFALETQKLSGTLPPALWSLPNLSAVSTGKTGLSIVFPPVISQKLFVIALAQNNISTPLPPTFNFSNFQILDLSFTNLRCPLPSGFIQAARNGQISLKCLISHNFLPLDAEEVHVNDLACVTTPQLPPAPSFPRDYRVPATTTQVDLGPYRLEFSGRDLLIFPAYTKNRTRERVVYRDEYLLIHGAHAANNRLELPSKDIFGTFPMESFPLSATQQITQPRPDTVVSTSFFAGGNFSFTFICRLQNGALKYSTELRNIRHVWKNATTAPFFVLPAVAAFKAPHSPGGSSLRCTSDFFFRTCVSGRGSRFSIEPDLISLGARVSLSTNQTSSSFLYNSFNGSIDGAPFDITNGTKLELATIFYPLGQMEYLDIVNEVFPNVSLPAGPDSEQVIYNVLSLGTRIFQDDMFYDPEVSITLLFLPSEELAPEAGASVQDETVALAVGITVAILVVIGGSTAFAFVVYPYLKQRQAKKAQEATAPIATSGDDAQRKNSKWAAASPTDKTPSLSAIET